MKSAYLSCLRSEFLNRTAKAIQHFTSLIGIVLVVLMSSFACASSRPNVVIILADDLGWSDTTLYGTTNFYKTPNIQRLAERGMTFTHAYSSSPLCSPTRASILTGLSPARTGITAPNCHLPQVVLQATPNPTGPANHKATFPNPVTRLDKSYYTLAEMFKDNGYATGHFGKWHLGATPFSPLEHGFDVDIPHWPGPGPAGSYVAPWKYPDFDPQTPNEHIEDRMADEAVAFMEQHQNDPFFLNYWMFSVHAPFDAKQDLIDQYKKNVNPNDPQRSPTYAAMVESMDDAVGTLIDTLDRLKIANNTIIIFASDNGGNMYNEVDGTSATSNAPLRGGKATMYEGGVRGPAIVAYPKQIKAGSRSEEIIQSSDFYPTILEMLSISPQAGQNFDGVSIVPALKGKKLNREAIFTYFPHSPPIPEWLPAAVSVHSEDWKLIRIFFGGENGDHRYKLYDLQADLGEQQNLASTMPEKVKELDLLIEEFLRDTNAVLPLPNPRFDASKYQPELEGKASLKGGSRTPKKKSAKPRGKQVAGWQPDGDCSLSLRDGNLMVSSTGGDPYLSYTLPESAEKSDFQITLKFSSNSSKGGQFYWTEQGKPGGFHRDRSILFDVTHDGQPHTYRLKWSTQSPLTAIRLDPSKSKGTVTIISIKIATSDGEVIYESDFK